MYYELYLPITILGVEIIFCRDYHLSLSGSVSGWTKYLPHKAPTKVLNYLFDLFLLQYDSIKSIKSGVPPYI